MSAKIVTAEIPAPRSGSSEDEMFFKGFLFRIEPPIVVSQEMVARTLEAGSISDPAGQEKDPSIGEAVLIGSTRWATTIYVGLSLAMQHGDEMSQLKGKLNEHIGELLEVMGVIGYNRLAGTDPGSYLL